MNQTNEKSVLHVLMYLFHHHMQEDCGLDVPQSQLTETLKNAGFCDDNINHAFTWLEQLSDQRQVSFTQQARKNSVTTLRIYTSSEQERLSPECRGYVLSLERSGILCPLTREIVINCTTSLPGREELDVSLVKWIVLMVLFNQPNSEDELEMMKLLVLADTPNKAH